MRARSTCSKTAFVIVGRSIRPAYVTVSWALAGHRSFSCNTEALMSDSCQSEHRPFAARVTAWHTTFQQASTTDIFILTESGALAVKL